MVIQRALDAYATHDKDPHSTPIPLRSEELSPHGGIIRGQGVALFVRPTGAIDNYVTGDDFLAPFTDRGLTVVRTDGSGRLIVWVSPTATRPLVRLRDGEDAMLSVRAPVDDNGSFAVRLESSDGGSSRIVAGQHDGPLVEWPASNKTLLHLSSDGSWLLIEGDKLEAVELPATPRAESGTIVSASAVRRFSVPKACGREIVFFDHDPRTHRLIVQARGHGYCEVTLAGLLVRRNGMASRPMNTLHGGSLVVDGREIRFTPEIQRLVLEGRAFLTRDDRNNTSIHDRDTGRDLFAERYEWMEAPDGTLSTDIVDEKGNEKRITLALRDGKVVQSVANREPSAGAVPRSWESKPLPITFSYCFVEDVPIPAEFCPASSVTDTTNRNVNAGSEYK